LSLVAGLALAGAGHSAAAADKLTFEKDVLPIFKTSCNKCHSLDNPKKKASSGLRLDTLQETLKGGKSGKDVIVGNAKDSVLYKILLGTVTVDGEDIEAMPKKKKGQEFKPLADAKIEIIKSWIDQGAE
jgi:hypothetical protein